MRNEIEILNYENKKIRTINKSDEVWFVLKDACEILSIKNPSQAAERLEEDERYMFDIGLKGSVLCVNEFGLYNLILRSDKPEAKKFKRWITHTVLPSIRKTGAYVPKTTSEDKLQELEQKVETLTNAIANLDKNPFNKKPINQRVFQKIIEANRSREDIETFKQVQNFLMLFSPFYFWELDSNGRSSPFPQEQGGFQRISSLGRRTYYIYPDFFNVRVIFGLNPEKVKKLLKDNGFLNTDNEDGDYLKTVLIDGRKQKMVTINGVILDKRFGD